MRVSLIFAVAFAAAGAIACATTTTSSPEGTGSDTTPTLPAESAETADDGPQDGASSGSTSGSSSGKTGSSSSGGSSGKTSSSSSSGGTSSSGGSSSSSGSLPDSCTPLATSCVKGGSMSYCISYAGNTCSKITYEHDGVKASCSCNAGGSDCTDAYYVAYTDCQDAVGACAELDSCCDTINASYEATCRSYVSTYQGQNYGDVSCKSVLTSWQSSGLCP